MALSNPYAHPPRPSGTERLRRAMTIGGAALSLAVVAGCSSEAQPAPDPRSGTATPPTMPLPTSPPVASPLDALSAAPHPVAAPAVATAREAPERPAAPAEPPAGPPPPVDDGADYRVVRGDTLSGIAARAGVEGGWPGLWARNCDVLHDPDLILPGQELDLDGPVLPGCGS